MAGLRSGKMPSNTVRRPCRRHNVALFIGDAMGTTDRDAARLVGRAIVDINVKNSLRKALSTPLGDGQNDRDRHVDDVPVMGFMHL